MSRRWNCGLTAVAIDNSGTNLATRRFVVNAGTPAELAKRTRLGRPAVSRSREPTGLVAGSPTFSSSSSSDPVAPRPDIDTKQMKEMVMEGGEIPHA